MMIDPQSRLRMAAFLVLGLTAALSAEPARVPGSQPAAASPGEPGVVIRIAVSSEAFRFVETGALFARDAASPALVRLEGGELLVLFESRLDTSTQKNQTRFFASRSKDEGKTWVPPRPIQIQGLPEGAKIGGLDLLVMPSGLVRMYLAVSLPAERRRKDPETIVLSAVTRDGVEYQIDRTVRIPWPGASGVHPVAWHADKQIVLLLADRADGRSAGSVMAQQFTSRDGRTFKTIDRRRPVGELGHVLRLDANHWRMYISRGNDIRARMSNDGLRWREESDTCLKNGFDAAVAPLSDRKFLMLFCAEADRQGAERSPLTAVTPEAGASGGASAELPSKKDAGDSRSSGDGDTSGKAAWEPFTTASTSLEGFDEQPGSDPWTVDGTFAPKADLKTKFDYVQWYQRQLMPAASENSYYSYESWLTPTDANGNDKPEWVFDDRLNGDGAYLPGPWRADEHPTWENSYQLTQGIMGQYMSAVLDPRPWSLPLLQPPYEGIGGDEATLAAPTCDAHTRDLRAMVKATLSQAWRAGQDGQVSPEAIRQSWATVLSNADQLEGGTTVVDVLMARAFKTMTQDEARWALAQGAFNDQAQLESALQTLQRYDSPADPNPRWLRAEHARMMDAIQYMFEPAGPDGEPMINTSRARFALTNSVLNDEPVTDESLAGITPEMGRAAIDAADQCFQAMNENWARGYQAVVEAGHSPAGQQWADTNVLTHPLRNLARVKELEIRELASRRATQLACRLQMYRAQTGRWPSSLGEVPDDYGYEMKIDPFTGSHFGYVVTDTGPRVYTRSLNGRDDGGVHSPNWADDGGMSGSDDYVFWPPQR